MSRFRVLLTGLVVIVSSAFAPSASASTLPLAGFDEMLVDSAHSHVFLTPGPLGSTITVVDFEGAQVGSIPGQAGGAGMALSADSSKLYVALHTADAISVIDTATLTEASRIPLANKAPEPVSIVRIGDVLWVSYMGNGAGIGGGLAKIVTTAIPPDVVAFPDAKGGGASSLVTHGSILYAAMRYQSPTYLFRIDVSSGSPVVTHELSNAGGAGNLQDLAITPDGSKVILAAGGPYVLPVFSGADLSAAGTYPANAYPLAVAVTPSGSHVAAGMYAPYDPDIKVTPIGGDTPNFVYNDSSTTPELAARGLEFSPDASRLFAVYTNSFEHLWSFKVISDPTLEPSSLTAAATPNSVVVGHATVVSGALSFPLGGNASGLTLNVTRRGPAAQSVDLAPLTTGASGSFSFSDTPLVGGGYTYDIVFGGDAGHRSATTSVPLSVTKLTTTITLARSASVVTYGGAVRVTAHLGTTWNSRRIEIYYAPYGYSYRLLAAGNVDSRGNYSALYKPGRRTAFYAAFPGDDRYARAQSTQFAVLVKPLVTGVLSGYHATSGSYKLYRAGVHPVITGRVSPVHYNHCLYFVIQRYASGRWSALSRSGCFRMNSAGSIAVRYLGTLSRSVLYRMNVEFGGDVDHTRASSTWSYLRVG